MTFLFVANTGWYLYNFRMSLLLRLQQQGVRVIAVTPEDQFVAPLQEMGIEWREWKVSRNGMNPFLEWQKVRSLADIYRAESPQLVHHFTIKPILYGTQAAKKAKVSYIVNSVTGLGHMFVSESWKARFLRPLIGKWYRYSLTGENIQSMFQNQDDINLLSQMIPGLQKKTTLTKGSGVNLNRFQPTNHMTKKKDFLTVLFAGRLLREKGIVEFVEAAKKLQHLPLKFIVCGSPDFGNPSSITSQLLEKWTSEKIVHFKGHVEKMEEELRDVDIVVLPSYREGTPRILLEASAMGIPMITCDVPGCRDVVTHKREGLLVPPQESDALAEAIELLVNDNGLRITMGENARKRAEQEFDEERVIEQTFDIYQNLTGRKFDATVSQSKSLQKQIIQIS